jgi:hypothetical protein
MHAKRIALTIASAAKHSLTPSCANGPITQTNSSTANKGTYAFFFNQRGLMADLITKGNAV